MIFSHYSDRKKRKRKKDMSYKKSMSYRRILSIWERGNISEIMGIVKTIKRKLKYGTVSIRKNIKRGDYGVVVIRPKEVLKKIIDENKERIFFHPKRYKWGGYIWVLWFKK